MKRTSLVFRPRELIRDRNIQHITIVNIERKFSLHFKSSLHLIHTTTPSLSDRFSTYKVINRKTSLLNLIINYSNNYSIRHRQISDDYNLTRMQSNFSKTVAFGLCRGVAVKRLSCLLSRLRRLLSAFKLLKNRQASHANDAAKAF